MSDQPLTAAAIISFTERLEDASATFYEALAKAFPEHARTFEGYARDCGKHKVQVQRTYQETITDALEAGYSFEGLRLADYAVATDLPGGANLSDALRMALALEDTAIAYYTRVAEACESLLATIPRAFSRVAKRRTSRREELRDLAA
ncbi:MAG: hypothetical protein FJZ90_06395 [Chloroflexi bacterium]|nr:hypothetical protein [Chloroflexota bacterium]